MKKKRKRNEDAESTVPTTTTRKRLSTLNAPKKKKRRLRTKKEALATAVELNIDIELLDDEEAGFIVYSDDDDNPSLDTGLRTVPYKNSRRANSRTKKPTAISSGDDDDEDSDVDEMRRLRHLGSRLSGRFGSLPDTHGGGNPFDEFESTAIKGSTLIGADGEDDDERSRSTDYGGRKKRKQRMHRQRQYRKRKEDAKLPFWERQTFFKDPTTTNVIAYGNYLEWQRKMKERDFLRIQGLRSRPYTDSELQVPKLGLRSRLKIHQLAGIAWCVLRENIPYRGVRGGIIGDDMGSGKTLLTMSLIAFDKVCGYIRDTSTDIFHAPPTLVVCPASLIESWSAEWEKHFAPERMKMIFLRSGNKRQRDHTNIKDLLEADGIVVSYESIRSMHQTLARNLSFDMQCNPEKYSEWLGRFALHKDRSKAIKQLSEFLTPGFRHLWPDPDKWTLPQFLFGYGFRRLVLDESTRVSRSTTRNFRSVSALRFERIWQLTGTPLQNNIGDLYSQLRVLQVTRHMKQLSSTHQWNTFLRSGDKNLSGDRKVNHGATYEAIDGIKRKFLNIGMMRRATDTISLIDPLAPYITRSTERTGEWDDWVVWRSQDRSLRRNPKARAFEEAKRQCDAEARRQMLEFIEQHPNDPEAIAIMEELDADDAMDVEMAIEDDNNTNNTTGQMLGAGWSSLPNHKREHLTPAIRSTPAGFYWDTPQVDFLEGYDRADAWIRATFPFGIADISNSIQSMRGAVMSHNGGRFPDADNLRDTIYQSSELYWSGDDKVDVWCGVKKERPILLLGDMNALERRVYRFVTMRASSMLATSDEKTRQGSAFVAITFARATVTDYRLPSGAAKLLHYGKGTLYPENTECMNFKVNPDHARQELEDWKMFSKYDDNAAVVVVDNANANVDEDDDGDATDGPPTNTLSTEDRTFIESMANIYQSLPIDADGEVVIPENDEMSSYNVPVDAPTKLKILLRYVKSVPAKDKLLVFIDMTKPIPYMRKYLEKHGITVATLVGYQTPKERKAQREMFQRPNTEDNSAQVFILSFKLASHGYNFQHANHCIFYSIWWNPASDEQAKGRIDRMGQYKHMYFVYIALRNTIDELVLTRAGDKADMVTQVIGTDDGLIVTGANIMRPVDNQGILIDTTQPPLENETIEDIIALPIVKFDRDEIDIQIIENLRSEVGKLDRVKFAQLIVKDAEKLFKQGAT